MREVCKIVQAEARGETFVIETFVRSKFFEVFKFCVDKLSGNAKKEELCEINFRKCPIFFYNINVS